MPDAHMLFCSPILQMELADLQLLSRIANKMKLDLKRLWMMGLPREGGLKVGSNLPISQLGVVKCLARGRQGDRSGLPEIIVKQGIPLQLDIHTSATRHSYFCHTPKFSATKNLEKTLS